MDKVKLKAKNPNYDGTMYGYQFLNGEHPNVPIKDAEYMEANFGVEIVKPEQPKTKPKAKAKAQPKKKDE